MLSLVSSHSQRRILSIANHIRTNVRTSSTLLEPTAYSPANPEPPYEALGSTTKLNLFSAINSALKTAMETDPTAILFGEDIAFGGVFRCSQGLREEFGEGRVFNTPLSENGIAVS
jgi:2-oxoisovalerate dehydrogenase E1 component beta subunit